MKYLIVICILLFSCNKDKPKEYIVYNEVQWEDLWNKDKKALIKVIDTQCINETEKAKLDIQNGKLVYFGRKFAYGVGEMKILLEKMNIQLTPFTASCFGSPSGFERNCYKNIMHYEISMRYGSDFIDSLWLEADKNTLRKYPNRLYIEDGQDIRIKLRELFNKN